MQAGFGCTGRESAAFAGQCAELRRGGWAHAEFYCSVGVANLCRRLERAKNVGAHKPTKIPNRSPWARSGSLAKNQIAMDAVTDRKPATKQKLLRARQELVDIVVSLEVP